jgi:hypothetical protein
MCYLGNTVNRFTVKRVDLIWRIVRLGAMPVKEVSDVAVENGD